MYFSFSSQYLCAAAGVGWIMPPLRAHQTAGDISLESEVFKETVELRFATASKLTMRANERGDRSAWVPTTPQAREGLRRGRFFDTAVHGGGGFELWLSKESLAP